MNMIVKEDWIEGILSATVIVALMLGQSCLAVLELEPKDASFTGDVKFAGGIAVNELFKRSRTSMAAIQTTTPIRSLVLNRSVCLDRLSEKMVAGESE